MRQVLFFFSSFLLFFFSSFLLFFFFNAFASEGEPQIYVSPVQGTSLYGGFTSVIDTQFDRQDGYTYLGHYFDILVNINNGDELSLMNEGVGFSIAGSYSSACDINHNEGQTSGRHSTFMQRELLGALVGIAIEYGQLTGGGLSFNDGSLEWGGAFDKGPEGGGYNRNNLCHKSHVRGVDIDVNSIDSLGRDINSYVLGGKKLITLLDKIFYKHGGHRVNSLGLHYRFIYEDY